MTTAETQAKKLTGSAKRTKRPLLGQAHTSVSGTATGRGSAKETTPAPSETDAFRAFTYAVLAKHKPNTASLSSTEMCLCGAPTVLCDYTRLARELLEDNYGEVKSDQTGQLTGLVK